MVVSSTRPPILEFDPEAAAKYVRFSSRKVAKTVEKECAERVLTVDLDRSGRVVGVEAIGFTEFTLAQLLKSANVRTDGIDFSKARFRASRHEEREAVFA